MAGKGPRSSGLPPPRRRKSRPAYGRPGPAEALHHTRRWPAPRVAPRPRRLTAPAPPSKRTTRPPRYRLGWNNSMGIAGGVVEQDLRSAGPLNDVVAESSMRLPDPDDLARKVVRGQDGPAARRPGPSSCVNPGTRCSASRLTTPTVPPCSSPPLSTGRVLSAIRGSCARPRTESPHPRRLRPPCRPRGDPRSGRSCRP